MKNKFFKVFNKKGELDIKGLIYQLNKSFAVDPRPFVQDLIIKELEKVEDEIRNMKLKKPKWNIKIAAINEHFEKLKASSIDMSTDLCIAYYEYLKLIEDKTDYSWVSEYVTKANVCSEKPVVLFNSNNIGIYIENGILYMETNTVSYNVEIKYDSSTNSFYI